MPIRQFRFLLPYLVAFNVISFAGASAPSHGAAWVDAGNEMVRHHLQVLSDSGAISVPLTTWPIMWSGISRSLASIEQSQLTDHERWSYQYLRHELRRARRKASAGQQLSVNSSIPGLAGFSSDSREQWESRSYGNYTGERWTMQLQASAVGSPLDGHRYRLDGSYLATIWGNWAVGLGAIDRWWGPGWQSSLILSNAARPSPGFFLHRVDSQPMNFPVLELLGPWDLQLFMNQLESNRATPEAKLFGARVTLKPVQSLEIGLSRTAQWGGERRPEDLETFWNLLVGRDNRGEGPIEEDMSNEPGNQLAGIDWRLSHGFSVLSAAFYGQLIGEDEAGGLPSHLLGMAGVETSFSTGQTHNRLALELSNTTMEFYKNSGSPNVAYEHPLYPSGYRFRGRPLGASTDNDSELMTIKGIHSWPNGHGVSWTIGYAQINTDGGDHPDGGSVWGANAISTHYGSAQYSLPVGSQSQVAFSAQYYDQPLELQGELVETGVSLTYKLRL